MIELLIWILAVYGTTTILVSAKITEPLRNWVKFSKSWENEEGKKCVIERENEFAKFCSKILACFLCTGFWVSIFWSIFVWSPSSIYMINWNPLRLLFDGCVGACCVWTMFLYLSPKTQGK